MTVANEHIAHHKHVMDLYRVAFKDVDGITVHDNPNEKFDSNFWLSTILIDSEKTGTDYEKVRQHLDSVGIESRPLWKPMHTQPFYKDAPRYVNGVSEEMFSKGLCLPSGPCVSDEDVEKIVREIKSCIQ